MLRFSFNDEEAAGRIELGREESTGAGFPNRRHYRARHEADRNTRNGRCRVGGTELREYEAMKRVGLVGWRGMVGSVLMQRMREENDFSLIEPVFFTTSNVGGNGPDISVSLGLRSRMR
jgi:hypothetical protein